MDCKFAKLTYLVLKICGQTNNIGCTLFTMRLDTMTQANSTVQSQPFKYTRWITDEDLHLNLTIQKIYL